MGKMMASKITAKLISSTKASGRERRIYRLSPPLEDGTEYVAVSAVDYEIAPGFPVCETYIFRSNQEGTLMDLDEMTGSFQGAADHERAIREAGWELA
jgi:hypothetical protein